jgi:hypothetical protein
VAVPGRDDRRREAPASTDVRVYRVDDLARILDEFDGDGVEVGASFEIPAQPGH